MAGGNLATPEALNIPTFNPLQRGYPLPPIVAVANAATSLTIYDETKDTRCRVIILQNLSTTPVKYAWGTACKDDNFHGVLAGCAAQDDGLGGSIELKVRENGYKSISLYCESATIRCSVNKIQIGVVPQFIS